MTEIPDGYTPAPVELPEVRILRLEPGDMLLVSSPLRLSDADVAFIGDRLKGKFPGHEAVILDGGLTLDILRKGGDQ